MATELRLHDVRNFAPEDRFWRATARSGQPAVQSPFADEVPGIPLPAVYVVGDAVDVARFGKVRDGRHDAVSLVLADAAPFLPLATGVGSLSCHPLQLTISGSVADPPYAIRANLRHAGYPHRDHVCCGIDLQHAAADELLECNRKHLPGDPWHLLMYRDIQRIVVCIRKSRKDRTSTAASAVDSAWKHTAPFLPAPRRLGFSVVTRSLHGHWWIMPYVYDIALPPSAPRR